MIVFVTEMIVVVTDPIFFKATAIFKSWTDLFQAGHDYFLYAGIHFHRKHNHVLAGQNSFRCVLNLFRFRHKSLGDANDYLCRKENRRRCAVDPEDNASTQSNAPEVAPSQTLQSSPDITRRMNSSNRGTVNAV